MQGPHSENTDLWNSVKYYKKIQSFTAYSQNLWKRILCISLTQPSVFNVISFIWCAWGQIDQNLIYGGPSIPASIKAELYYSRIIPLSWTLPKYFLFFFKSSHVPFGGFFLWLKSMCYLLRQQLEDISHIEIVYVKMKRLYLNANFPL